jgi:hypothetical protein
MIGRWLAGRGSEEHGHRFAILRHLRPPSTLGPVCAGRPVRALSHRASARSLAAPSGPAASGAPPHPASVAVLACHARALPPGGPVVAERSWLGMPASAGFGCASPLGRGRGVRPACGGSPAPPHRPGPRGCSFLRGSATGPRCGRTRPCRLPTHGTPALGHGQAAPRHHHAPRRTLPGRSVPGGKRSGEPLHDLGTTRAEPCASALACPDGPGPGPRATVRGCRPPGLRPLGGWPRSNTPVARLTPPLCVMGRLNAATPCGRLWPPKSAPRSPGGSRSRPSPS